MHSHHVGTDGQPCLFQHTTQVPTSDSTRPCAEIKKLFSLRELPRWHGVRLLASCGETCQMTRDSLTRMSIWQRKNKQNSPAANSLSQRAGRIQTQCWLYVLLPIMACAVCGTFEYSAAVLSPDIFVKSADWQGGCVHVVRCCLRPDCLISICRCILLVLQCGTHTLRPTLLLLKCVEIWDVHSIFDKDTHEGQKCRWCAHNPNLTVTSFLVTRFGTSPAFDWSCVPSHLSVLIHYSLLSGRWLVSHGESCK